VVKLGIFKTFNLNIALLIVLLGINTVLASTEDSISVEGAAKDIKADIAKTLEAKEIALKFQDELIAAMQQGETLGFQGRYDKLETAIVKSHDLVKIARIVIGKEWKKISEEQRAVLVDVFRRLSISAYAYNFKAYSGESFEFVSEEKTARGGMIVRTLFVLPDDKDVKFDYMLKKKGNEWRIINIIANGVSDLALKRSEYTSILKRQGFDALIAKINEKIDNYAK